MPGAVVTLPGPDGLSTVAVLGVVDDPPRAKGCQHDGLRRLGDQGGSLGIEEENVFYGNDTNYIFCCRSNNINFGANYKSSMLLFR